MSIQPASSGRSNPSAAAPEKPALEGPARSNPMPARAAARALDRAELSAASRALAEGTAHADVPAGEVPAERLREIADRIAARHYDRPEVRDQVILRALDLG